MRDSSSAADALRLLTGAFGTIGDTGATGPVAQLSAYVLEMAPDFPRWPLTAHAQKLGLAQL